MKPALTVCVALVAASLATPVLAVSAAHNVETLRGLDGMTVVVETFEEEDRRAKFNVSTLQTDVESTLRRVGIQVLSREDRARTTAGAYLYVNVQTLAEQPGESAAFNIHIALKQRVRLLRDASFIVLAATWSDGVTGIGHWNYVRVAVKNEVDRFINDWLSVNPK
jgi:hypothetical protein